MNFVSKIFLAAFLGLCVLTSPAIGAELLSTDELRELQLKMKSAAQLSVDFTQSTTAGIRPDRPPAKSAGRAIFSKPTKFRWELIKPPALRLFDGKALYEVNVANKTATRYRTTAQKSQDIQEVIDLVLDFDSLLERYKMLEAIKVGADVKMKLKPKVQGNISEVEVILEAASATIRGITLIYPNKNQSRFEFANPSRSPVSPSSFEVPKGYKILEGV